MDKYHAVEGSILETTLPKGIFWRLRQKLYGWKEKTGKGKLDISIKRKQEKQKEKLYKS